MQNNKYLLLFCTIIILSTGFIRVLNVTGENMKAQVIEVSGGIGNNKGVHDIFENLLIEESKKSLPLAEPAPVVPPKPIIPKPYISAEAYLVANIETGEVYVSQAENSLFPIASISKLYTALVAVHLFNLQEKITITEQMLDTYSDVGNLVLGEKYLPSELLYPLLLESSNDAAEAYAQSFGSEKFMVQMNDFANEIGMKNTYFKDSSGLSPINKSSAKDLFILAQYLYKNEKRILDITRNKEMELSATGEHGAHKFVNINPYSNYKDFIGGKTGRTEWAKETMVSLFSQNVQGKNFQIAIILLRSDLGQREIDTEKLLGKFIDKVSDAN